MEESDGYNGQCNKCEWIAKNKTKGKTRKIMGFKNKVEAILVLFLSRSISITQYSYEAEGEEI